MCSKLFTLWLSLIIRLTPPPTRDAHVIIHWYHGIKVTTPSSPASLMFQSIKSLPAMKGMQVQSLGQKDPLEKEMATHSSILPWTEEPSRL